MIREFETFNIFRLPMCSKVRGEYIEQGLTILNIKNLGLTFTYKSMKYVKLSSKITQNYFPETLGKMYVINASGMFSAIWAMVKPFIDDKTRLKIHVFQEDFLNELLKDVEKSNLPKLIGGDCDCKEFGGCLFSDKGPWNPY